MSDNGVLSALRRMGFPSDEMTGHGFRAMARDLPIAVAGLHFRDVRLMGITSAPSRSLSR